MNEQGMWSRREFAAGVAAFFFVGLRGKRLAAEPPATMVVYKSKSCGCCAKWVDHVKAAGFKLQVHDEESMDPLKDELGIPQQVRSCHTALVGGYVIEGHVPASDIQRLLSSRPKVAGLAVPGMPGGTPGMAEPGAKIGDFEVVAFQTNGSTDLFARH
jgi:hypothetical protein